MPSSSGTPWLPQEIRDDLVRQLDLASDRSSLNACALAHRSFLPSCQAGLFREQKFTSANAHDSSSRTVRAMKLLDKSPHLVQYIQFIHLVEEPWRLWIAKCQALPRLLRRLTQLNSMNVSWKESYERCSDLLSALDHVFRLPTFHHFRASQCWNFPPRLLSHMPYLRTVKLDHLRCSPRIAVSHARVRCAQLTSMELRLSITAFAAMAVELRDPDCSLDLSNLRHVTTGLIKNHGMFLDFLNMTPLLFSIQSLDLTLYEDAVANDPTPESSPLVLGDALPRLRHLSLQALPLRNLQNDIPTADCFVWLSYQLSSLTGLESLDLHFHVALRTAGDGDIWKPSWHALDNLLYQMTGLSRVRVHIAHVLDYLPDYKAEENAIAQRVKACLPLLDARGILSVLSGEHVAGRHLCDGIADIFRQRRGSPLWPSLRMASTSA
ncbi:hypothetical protein BD626DRAFT_413894 [Schizophyllum amplum]|uniref:F-box domain-containing protein n=1 Tax=Schizophyllum amplum TaxID=97359 RepID=A0A550BV76_9AGAR|nr:hypothetical protein BD626DRAFT_413894 [Auriculariopsis ampla]